MRKLSLGAGTVFLLACAVYVNTAGNSFTLDDEPAIVSNESIRDPLDFVTIYTTEFWGQSAKAAGRYRPLVAHTFALNFWIGELEPRGYHLVNILCHACCSVLLFLVAHSLFGGLAPALFAGMLFAVHPAHTEAVANVTGRAELLCAMFGLATLLCHMAAGRAQGRLRRVLQGCSFACYVAALLSKESGLTIVGILLGHDLLLGPKRSKLSPDAESRSGERFPYGYYLGLAAVSVLYLAWRRYVLGSLLMGQIDFFANPAAHVGVAGRVLTAVKVMGQYLWLLLVPVRLSAEYSFDQITVARSLLDLTVLIPLAVCLLGAVVAVRMRAQQSRYAFFIMFYAVAFSLTSNILFPIGTIMAERLLYLPSAAFCLLLGHVLWRAAGRCRVSGVALATAIVCLWSLRTVERNRDWRDNYRVFASAVRVCPRSLKMRAYLGNELLNHRLRVEAAEQFRAALRIKSDDVNARIMLARTYLEMDKRHLAEAELRKVLARDPTCAWAIKALNRLGHSSSDRGAAPATSPPRPERSAP